MIEPLHRTPGQLIQSLLEIKGWTQQVLSIVLNMDRSIVSKVIAGKRPLDAQMAIALSDVFGVPAETFMELQKKYDLAQAEIISMPDPGRATRAHLFGGLPITEMIKRGWLPHVTDIKDVPKVEQALMRFFHAPSLDDIEVLPHAAKKTQVSSEVNAAQLAWLYRVREIASEMLVPRYSPSALKAAVAELSRLRSDPESTRKVPRILAECGIRFAIVEALPTSKIDGVCFWLDDNSPVVAMSMRFDRIDNFWFVLRHELEHVLQLHGKNAVMVDADTEGAGGIAVSDEEKIANEAAAEFCVPQKSLAAFIARKAPIFADRDVVGFARTLKIHPGLVAGQLRRRLGRYDRFQNHLAKIRSAIAPAAVVDGWGDVVPVGEE